MKTKIYTALMAVLFLSLTSCDKDNKKEKEPTPTPPSATLKEITINASNYAKWTYVNLKTGEMKSFFDFSDCNYFKDGKIVETKPARGKESDLAGFEWHIALNHAFIRTNGGEAIETAVKDLNTAPIPKSGYEKDKLVENKVLIDMTFMMQGKVGYAAKSYVNPALFKAYEHIKTGGMPPVEYKPTGKVMVLKCKDGSVAKLKFGNFYKEGEAGYVALSYLFFPAK
ncbi:HmuY family protein [Porphyromonas macacae]|uniref:HmuY family protein n=1 Tax=Porphyromonas macacae TaxID=28115 RepID=UPI0024ACCD0A|nr:HmuY family protein [Porphyromonas macacae]